jgi:NTE family protein
MLLQGEYPVYRRKFVRGERFFATIRPLTVMVQKRESEGRADPTLREWLREHPFALGMSSGFFGFFAHAGVLTVLEDEGLLPVRLSGSSAGALIAGLWGSGVSAARIRDELLALRREDFWDPAPGLGFLRGRLFLDRVSAILPVATFEGCRVPVSVSVFDVLERRTRVLSEGALAPAIVASCSVPFMFHPAWINGRPLLDGGIADRAGLDGIPEGARVLHHHLAARSLWRRPGSPALQVPKRPGLVALVIEGLPRVGPMRLPEGARAFERARAATKEALGQRAFEGAVRL